MRSAPQAVQLQGEYLNEAYLLFTAATASSLDNAFWAATRDWLPNMTALAVKVPATTKAPASKIPGGEVDWRSGLVPLPIVFRRQPTAELSPVPAAEVQFRRHAGPVVNQAMPASTLLPGAAGLPSFVVAMSRTGSALPPHQAAFFLAVSLPIDLSSGNPAYFRSITGR